MHSPTKNITKISPSKQNPIYPAYQTLKKDFLTILKNLSQQSYITKPILLQETIEGLQSTYEEIRKLALLSLTLQIKLLTKESWKLEILSKIEFFHMENYLFFVGDKITKKFENLQVDSSFVSNMTHCLWSLKKSKVVNFQEHIEPSETLFYYYKYDYNPIRKALKFSIQDLRNFLTKKNFLSKIPDFDKDCLVCIEKIIDGSRDSSNFSENFEKESGFWEKLQNQMFASKNFAERTQKRKSLLKQKGAKSCQVLKEEIRKDAHEKLVCYCLKAPEIGKSRSPIVSFANLDPVSEESRTIPNSKSAISFNNLGSKETVCTETEIPKPALKNQKNFRINSSISRKTLKGFHVTEPKNWIKSNTAKLTPDPLRNSVRFNFDTLETQETTETNFSTDLCQKENSKVILAKKSYQKWLLEFMNSKKSTYNKEDTVITINGQCEEKFATQETENENENDDLLSIDTCVSTNYVEDLEKSGFRISPTLFPITATHKMRSRKAKNPVLFRLSVD